MAKYGGLTCLTCHVAFASSTAQRDHYKCDWHTYNLKRKVAQLAPLSAEKFNSKVLAQRQQAEVSQTDSFHCAACSKHFVTENSLNSHLASKKHKETLDRVEKSTVEEKNQRNKVTADNGKTEECKTKKTDGNKAAEKAEPESMENEDDSSSVESWSGDALGLEECLFCSYVSPTMDKSLEHMKKHHSFYIPDFEYICDMEGLIGYLGQKVGEGQVCLWCDHEFVDVQAVQRHMKDRGHCRMMIDGDKLYEYTDYYDYSSSYPDDASDKDEDMDVDIVNNALEENLQLVLPSGSVLGHRSLQRYYRQKLRPDRPRATKVSQILAASRGLTASSRIQCTKQRAKDMKFLKRAFDKNRLKQGLTNNKLQKHFRDQVFGF